MIGIYFSGTGNSKYAVELFLKEYGADSIFSIEDKNHIEHIKNHDEIVFGYPVQYSDVPKYLKDYIQNHSELWKGKRVFIIATMALFSGDGAGVLGRILKQHGAQITGGLHLQMPDSIADEKVLKRSQEKNMQLIEKAEQKVIRAVANIKKGNFSQEGLGWLSHLAGFISQRLWFGHRTRTYSDKLKVNVDKCIGCSKCARICPTGNIVVKDGKAVGLNKCTVCYRCVNACPKQAITLLGKSVVEQTTIEKYRV